MSIEEIIQAFAELEPDHRRVVLAACGAFHRAVSGIDDDQGEDSPMPIEIPGAAYGDGAVGGITATAAQMEYTNNERQHLADLVSRIKQLTISREILENNNGKS